MWLANIDLLFILLQKKECKLIKKLVKILPSVVHQWDEDGNDPLLYVCLKVRGCRHRLVEFFIEMGCDLQRRNSKGENFIDVLQLKRNRKLLENLLERETVQIDHIQKNFHKYYKVQTVLHKMFFEQLIQLFIISNVL